MSDNLHLLHYVLAELICGDIVQVDHYNGCETLTGVDLHCESKKTRHQTLAMNVTKYWPIFKILSLLDSVGNL